MFSKSQVKVKISKEWDNLIPAEILVSQMENYRF